MNVAEVAHEKRNVKDTDNFCHDITGWNTWTK
jgi:hypothetical protein